MPSLNMRFWKLHCGKMMSKLEPVWGQQIFNFDSENKVYLPKGNNISAHALLKDASNILLVELADQL